MGKLYRRSGIYYMHDVIDGVEIRESLGTRNWQEARRVRNDRINEVKEGRATARGKKARQSFTAAVEDYLSDRHLHVERLTYVSDKDRSKRLIAFFGDTPLTQITGERIAAYQQARAAAGRSGRTINMEVRLLGRILKKWKLWKRVADEVDMLPQQSNVGRALEEVERRRLLETASTNPRWLVAYCAAVLALNTTMRSAELKGLQWKHVDLFKGQLTIQRSTTKTDEGARTLPLNRDAVWALAELWNRLETVTKTAGSNFKEILPEHYVFPACEHHHFDFTRPMKSWRSAWRSLIKKAGLEGLRFHDLRHSSVTVLAESGLSDQTIMAIAGHVSQRMLRHYSHIRMEAKRQAVAVLESASPIPVESTSAAVESRPN